MSLILDVYFATNVVLFRKYAEQKLYKIASNTSGKESERKNLREDIEISTKYEMLNKRTC